MTLSVDVFKIGVLLGSGTLANNATSVTSYSASNSPGGEHR
jgi:hypothetical protein